MKRMINAMSALALFALAIPAVSAQAATMPNFVMSGVAEVTIYSEAIHNDETRLKQGSGVFADHNGCLFTNAHVVLNYDTDEAYEHIGVSVSTNRGKAPVHLYHGEVVYMDQSVDMAYVCPNEETGVFTDYFDRYTEPMFEERAFGEDVWTVGYPGAGEGTITVSPGQIVGFMDAPDISEWVGVVKIQSEKLKLYKVDALSGPGISGGVMIDPQYRLMGIPFAGTLIPGAYTFVLSEDVYQGFERGLRLHQFRQGLTPLDCVLDESTGYYRRAGTAYYDNQCRWDYDASMEFEVKNLYKAFCAVDISQERMLSAIRRSKDLGDLSKWSDTVVARCSSKK